MASHRNTTVVPIERWALRIPGTDRSRPASMDRRFYHCLTIFPARLHTSFTVRVSSLRREILRLALRHGLYCAAPRPENRRRLRLVQSAHEWVRPGRAIRPDFTRHLSPMRPRALRDRNLNDGSHAPDENQYVVRAGVQPNRAGAWARALTAAEKHSFGHFADKLSC